MPELPEVETIVRDLSPGLSGRAFVDISSTHYNHVSGALDNAAAIVGKHVVKVGRRGKFICVFFENDYVMTIHLRMSGRILLRDLEEETLRFERTRIDFEGISLRFCDVRKFGKVWINKLANFEEATGISRLGVEPLSADFDLQGFKKMIQDRKGVAKKYLLDQSLIAGIGNIYADEACFYAGVRPDREVSTLKPAELELLFKSVVKALEQGIKNRGTSISDFADAYGKSGSNQELLYVYGRGGKKCLNCSATLLRSRVAGRGTVHCPNCQN